MIGRIWHRRKSIEDVVGRDMHESRTRHAGRIGEKTNREVVGTICRFRLAFREINRCKRSRVENRVWRNISHHTKHSITIADIELRLIERDDLNAV